MTLNLQVLADNRHALLLAETAAWLHDMGKCADEHLINQANDRPSEYHYQYKTAHSSLIAATLSLDLLGESVGLRTLIEQGMPRFVNDANRPWLLRVLGRCHAAAHIEKEEADHRGKQPASDTRMSTAYGFEQSPLSGLTAQLQSLPWASLVNDAIFRPAVRQVFSQALGETRRPENEVTLWDWSGLVGALYKAALAGALLGYQPEPVALRWRLLGVRVDEAAFLDHVSRLPDLLARQQLLRDGLERVRVLLEVTYPLGTEVYRDESGSLYVVPNLSNLCHLTAADGTTLEELIRHEFAQGTAENKPTLALSGETEPDIQFDPQAWWGQRPDFRNQPPSMDEVPPVGRMLQADVPTHADAEKVADWWADSARDICPVCGLRPQADPKSRNRDERKAGERKVCVVCEQRRADRAEEWTRNLHTTIWTDEVADKNGRLALVVGQFDLERWLDGTLVQTLTVTDPAQDGSPNKANVVRKTPSFARLRRVWETTRAFWQEVSDGLAAAVGTGAARLEICPQGGDKLDLGKFHTYELIVNGIRLSVVWDSDNRRFITCDNLDYLAKPEQLGAQVADIVKPGRSFPLEEPVGYGGANRRLGEITVDKVEALTDTYTPAIPILAEPRTFMALVPADKALAVAQAIKAKYEREMGKVRNRLPLTLGVVYAGRRAPLAAVLDTGRRMLRHPSLTVRAEVRELTPQNPDGWPSRLDVKLKVGEREIVIGVPTVMGDGTTPDVWYPYWQVAGKPSDRDRWFVGPDGEHWVHVCDLRPGDTVAFTPSTFDFEYLDTTARRFEVSYENGRRRGKDRAQRPYLLEELDQIEQARSEIRCLSTSQIKIIESLIEGKRRDWLATDTPEAQQTFEQFARDVLREAGIPSAELERAALTGMLADVLEIHLTICKEKLQL